MRHRLTITANIREFDLIERVYNMCRDYLDVHKRLDVLNQKLDIMKDMYEMIQVVLLLPGFGTEWPEALNTYIFQNELNVEHGNKLEVIVIILIVLEVVLEVSLRSLDHPLNEFPSSSCLQLAQVAVTLIHE